MVDIPRCYDLAQTFIVDAKAVKNASQVELNTVNLYFRRRPRRGDSSNKNKSGINEPGVNVILCDVKGSGVPDPSKKYASARLEYDDIQVSSDASAFSTATFAKNIKIKTDKTYAIVVMADGHEDFELWTNKKGNKLVGTNKPSSGTTDKNVLNLYTMLNRNADSTKDVNDKSNDDGNWIPLNDEDMKFKLSVRRFVSEGSTTTTTTGLLDFSPSEFVLYDRTLSTSETSARNGEWVFQNTAFHSGTVNVKKGSLSLVGTNVDFETLYGTVNNAYIVLVSESSSGAYESGDESNFVVDVRKITSVSSNNTLVIDRQPSFTNASAKFLLPTAVGQISFNSFSTNFTKFENANSWYFPDRVKQDLVVLKNSNANSSVKFVNNAIEGVVIVSGGSGYNNTDVLRVYSSTSGSLNCTANVVTNSSGGITSFKISNTGWGMIDQPLYIISNSTVLTSNTSSGSGASLTFIEGPTIRSEIEKFKLRDINVVNMTIDAIMPIFDAGTKPNDDKETDYYWHHSFYNDNGTLTQLATADSYQLDNLNRNMVVFKKDPVLVSKSNLLSGISNGSFGNSLFALANGTTVNSTASVLIEVKATTKSDFANPKTSDPPDIVYYKYSINNDYTGENTPFGNAEAKHITKKITFSEGRLAEDVMVYIRAFRPAGTDIKAFARLHNSQDSEAFDDKDWTLLDCISGKNNYSKKGNKNDLIEYTYTLKQYPNTQFTSPGVIEVANTTTTNIVGTGTSFTSQVQGFAEGDLVKIYSPIFPNNYFITAVTSVVNDTQITIANNSANASLVGTGFYIDKLAFKYQAFKDTRFQNVATYFSTSMQSFSGYDTVAVKLVLLSNSTSVVPEIDDIRVVGVSA